MVADEVDTSKAFLICWVQILFIVILVVTVAVVGIFAQRIKPMSMQSFIPPVMIYGNEIIAVLGVDAYFILIA